MHFNWDMVVPVLFQLYICLAILNRMRFLNREIFIITPETKCLLTALEHKFISRPYEAAASWNLLFPWFWKTTEHTEQWWDRYTERKRGKKKEEKKEEMSRYLFSQLPEYKTETYHSKGHSWNLQKCSLCAFNFFRSPWQDERGRGKDKTADIFPQKMYLLWVIFPTLFCGTTLERDLWRSTC